MPKFRKKPVVIDAEQFVEGSEHLPFHNNGDPVLYGCECGPNGACTFCDKFYIETLEWRMVVNYSDWVIRGIKGEFYPCKPDIFAATYESEESSVTR